MSPVLRALANLGEDLDSASNSNMTAHNLLSPSSRHNTLF